MDDRYFYLATPYSKYAGGIDEAFKLACRAAAEFVKVGIPVYSPIAHTHPVAIHGGIDPYDHRIWLPADEPFMVAARGLIVVMADGWDESFGIAEEIKHFQKAGKPIIYTIPGQVPVELLGMV